MDQKNQLAASRSRAMIGAVQQVTPDDRQPLTANKLLHRCALSRRLPVPRLLEGKPLSEWPGQWCYCKSANPRRSANILEKFGVGISWIPFETVRGTYNGKRMHYDRVMMPGYLFVSIEFGDDEACPLFDVKRAAKLATITHPRGMSQLRFRRDLDVLHVCSLDPTPKHVCEGLVKGRTVEIRQGHPMSGFTGVIAEINGVDKFVVLLPFMGRHVPFEFFPNFLEAVA